MRYINRIELCGVVGYVNHSKIGLSDTCNFSLMTEYENEVDWFNCLCYDKPGLDGLKKGDRVHLFGRVRKRRYLGSDNVDRCSEEIIVTDFKIIYE